VENIEELQKPPARRRGKGTKRDKFASFDRAPFMWLKTPDRVELWNRSVSMWKNGFRPSEVARILYEDYGCRIGQPLGDSDPERDQAALSFFARLVLPKDAPGAPSVFSDHGGRA
jgi:hypothetical protein